MFRKCLIEFFLLIPICGFSQNNIIHGQVLDHLQKGVPYASIRIVGTNEGSLANEDGYFSFCTKNPQLQYNLLVTAIGYREKKIDISQLNEVRIQLVQDFRQLNEIIITPDDFLKNLMLEAYKKIDDNYPQMAYELNGFYREAQKSIEGKFLYFGEAAIRLQQSGYKNSSLDAQIQILNSRIHKFTKDGSTDNVKYYGGIFIGNWNDPVKMRMDFLMPSSFDKKYTYYLESILSYNDSRDTIYVVEFKDKKEEYGIDGRLWIDKKRLAYVKIEYEKIKEYKVKLFSPVKYLRRKYRILYSFNDEVYLLKYTSVMSNVYNPQTKKESIRELEFLTTSVESGGDLKPIPFKDRIWPGTVFSNLNNSQDQHFWDSYNSIIMDSSNRKQMESLYLHNSEKGITYQKSDERVLLSNRDKAYRILKGVNLGYSLSGFEFNKHANEEGLVRYRDLEVKEGTFGGRFSPVFVVSVGYAINKLSSVRMDFSYPILNRDLLDIKQLSFSRYFLLKKIGNPVFFSTGLGLSWCKSGQRYGQLLSNENVIIENRNFGKNAAVYLGNKNVRGYMAAGLEYRSSRCSYFLTGGYSPSLTQNSYMVFSNRKNVFSAKKEWIRLSDKSIDIFSKKLVREILPYIVSLGVRVQL